MIVQKYIKRPEVVEAVQFTGGWANGEEIVNWVSTNGGVIAYIPEKPEDTVNTEIRKRGITRIHSKFYPGVPEHATLHTLKGDEVHVSVGMWIVKGIDGDFYIADWEEFNRDYGLLPNFDSPEPIEEFEEFVNDEVIEEPAICPECSAGKHQNCDGIAGVTDEGEEFIDCGCVSGDHPIRTVIHQQEGVVNAEM